MRLIDGDALIGLINGGYDLDFNEVPETKRELLRMIMEQPIVDAVPVIRCKDCKYASVGRNEADSWQWCKAHGRSFDMNDYCSWAERKEE